MIRKLLIGVASTLFCALLLYEIVSAMDSPNFRLAWFTPLTTGGGGAASSASYAVNVSVGQSVIGRSSSANYVVGQGYWYGIEQYHLHLPIVIK